MPNDLSEKALEVLSNYMRSGADKCLAGQLKKLGKDVSTLDRSDIPNLTALLERACAILMGPDKAASLVSELSAI